MDRLPLTCCQICGVGFTIGRHRTREEALAGTGTGPCDDFSRHSWNNSTGCQRGGCSVIDRSFRNYASQRTICITWDSPDDSPGAATPSHIEPIPTLGNDSIAMWTMEHLAGPDCPCEGAYNGNFISAEEMLGCCTCQCLIPKPQFTVPELDDADFESNSDFMLTGLSDNMPIRSRVGLFFPERHGLGSCIAANFFTSPDYAHLTGMPFHPTCLEVYKRASMLRFGHVDMEALYHWYCLEADFETFASFPRDEAVRRGTAWDHDPSIPQQWNHCRGDEALVANPVFVPALPSILDNAACRGASMSSLDEDATDISSHDSNQASDIFAVLPYELRFMVLSHLSPKDIATLRLASHTFRQLPQSFFRYLLRRECPWLWEIWSDLKYSFWASEKPAPFTEDGIEWQEKRFNFEQSIPVIGPGNSIPKPCSTSTREGELPLPTPVYLLSREKTDWYRLYCDLTKNWGRLRGLQNRKRIWKDCQEILYRIQRFKEAGIISPEINTTETRRQTAERSELALRINRAWHRYRMRRLPLQTFNWEEWATDSEDEE